MLVHAAATPASANAASTQHMLILAGIQMVYSAYKIFGCVSSDVPQRLCRYVLPLTMPKPNVTATPAGDTHCCNAVQLISFVAYNKQIFCICTSHMSFKSCATAHPELQVMSDSLVHEHEQSGLHAWHFVRGL